jgi:hypothetical protein
MDYFTNEYSSIPVDLIVCPKCNTELEPRDLLITQDYEMGHQLNKNKTVYDSDLHLTKFKSCPFCSKLLFADGKYVGRL